MTQNQKTMLAMSAISVVAFAVGGLKMFMLCIALSSLYWGIRDE